MTMTFDIAAEHDGVNIPLSYEEGEVKKKMMSRDDSKIGTGF